MSVFRARSKPDYELWNQYAVILVDQGFKTCQKLEPEAPRLSPALVRPVVAPGPHVQLQGYPGQMPLPSPAAPGTPPMALQSHPFAVAAPSMMPRLSSQALPAPRAAWPGPVAGVQHLAPAPVPPTQPLTAPLGPIPARAQAASARMPWGAPGARPILHQVTLGRSTPEETMRNHRTQRADLPGEAFKISSVSMRM